MKNLICIFLLLLLFGCDSGKKKMLVRPSEPPAPMLVPSDIAMPTIEQPKEEKDITVASPILNTDATDVTIEKKPVQLVETSSDAPLFHLCKNDDTIKNVAEKYNVDVNKLMKYNNLTPAQSLIPGKILLLPRKLSDLATCGEVTTYSIVKGDTYSRVARQYHISVKALMRLNNAKDSKLDIGDVLYVPKVR